MSDVVKLDSVSFGYDETNVLTDVDLAIPQGVFASIVGPNGGGKTTLVRLILGLLRPRKGTVRLFDDDPVKTRLNVGYTPQHLVVDFNYPISVLEVVLTGRLGCPGKDGRRKSFFSSLFYTKEDKDAACDAIRQMHLDGLEKRSFSMLSGGQRQRVLVARALCGSPKLLILDEPGNNIDPNCSNILFDLLKNLNQKITILVVSHDLGVVSQYSTSVICINNSVHVHPTSELNGTRLVDLYQSDIQLVRHDHCCSEHGHSSIGLHDNSEHGHSSIGLHDNIDHHE